MRNEARRLRGRLLIATGACLLLVPGCVSNPDRQTYDVIIRGGMVYDGSGSSPRSADVALVADRIAEVGDLEGTRGDVVIDATGLAVAPGFINMMSHTWETLIEDGRAQSVIRQGVTTEVFGEGWSIGPLNDKLKKQVVEDQTGIRYDVSWTSFGEGMEFLEQHGIAPNVVAFVGASTVRTHVLGYADRAPSPEELEEMRALVRAAMRDGAAGVGALLVSAPGYYAETEELIALARVAGEFGGSYISHMRSEGDYLIEAVEESIRIAREAGVPAEIYHLKAVGPRNWHKLEEAIRTIEAARSEGIEVTADVYVYNAAYSPLETTMPPWVQEGGFDAWAERLRDPETRARVRREMRQPGDGWENLYFASGPEKVVFAVFQTEALKPLMGKTLAEVAAARGTSPEDTLMDLVIEDGSNVFSIFYPMSEQNIRRKIAVPWVSFCAAGFAMSTESSLARSGMHPRSYGNFARLLGKYVREEGIVPLEEAIRRLTSQPAANLKLADRGLLAPGKFADLVVFDPATVQEHATFDDPHRYSTGMSHVFVNGEHVLKDGEPTETLPGRFLRGPGWQGVRLDD